MFTPGWRLALVGAALASLVGCGPDAASRRVAAAPFYDAGRAALQRADLDAAIAGYTEAIRLDPRFAEALNERGVAWDRKEEFEQAIADFEAAGVADPRLNASYVNRAALWKRQADWDRALTALDGLVEVQPNDAAYLARAEVHARRGDHQAALHDLALAVTCNPRSPWPFVDLSHYLIEQAQYDGAVEACSAGLELPSESADPATDGTEVGCALVEPGRRVQASVLLHNNHGEALRLLGDLDEALSAFDRASRLNPRIALPYINRAAVWRAKGELDKALAEAHRAIEIDGAAARAWYVLGQVHLDRADLYAASEAFDRTVDLDTASDFYADSYARFLSTCLRDECRNGPLAVLLATKACELTDWRKAEYIDTLAAAAAASQEFAAAVKWQEQAIALVADDKHVRAAMRDRLALYRANMLYIVPIKATREPPGVEVTAIAESR